MPTITATVASPKLASFRAAQAAGMFDAALSHTAQHFQCDLPAADENWRIGLVVGPSGSGKTTIARAAFGDAVYQPGEWPRDRAIIDGFGDVPTKRIIRTLTAVGLGSPPSWLKPHHVLSTGERFRCDLARALVECGMRSAECGMKSGSLVVIDEFTSSLDRTVARLASGALARHLRRGEMPVRFVAVTCHDDVVEWLAPDWILDMGCPTSERSGQLSRRPLRRPPLELTVHRAGRDAWPAFAPHHYLSGELHRSARCYVGVLTMGTKTTVVAFAATLQMPGRPRHRRFHRLVVLPEYQGIGLGGRFLDAVAELHRDEGLRINIATGHPAIISHCRASPDWRTVSISRCGRKPRVHEGRVHDHSFGRPLVSFEQVGRPSPADPALARAMCRSRAPASP